MSNQNLKTDWINAWNDEVAKLTPDERQKLAAATPTDWINAIADCITDPGFWQTIGTAFLEGIADGIGDYLNDRR